MKAAGRIIIAAAVCAMGVSIAQAGVVSFNVDNNGTVYSTDVLGAVAVDGWYNTWNGSGQDWWLADLNDSDGNPTTLNVGWVGTSGDWRSVRGGEWEKKTARGAWEAVNGRDLQ